MLALLLGASVFATWNTGQLLFLLLAARRVDRLAVPASRRGAGGPARLTVAAWAASRMSDRSPICRSPRRCSRSSCSTRRSRSPRLPLGPGLRTRPGARTPPAGRRRSGRAGPQRTAQLVEANEHLGHEITERRDAETKLRRSEHELAEAQDLARLGSWEWDLGAGTVAWSDDLYRIHGYEPGAFPMTFEKAVELVPEEDRQRIERNLAAALAMRQRELPEIEYRIVRPDGELRALLGRARLFLERPAPPSGCSASSRTSPNASITTASTGSPRRSSARCSPRTSRRSTGSRSPLGTCPPRWGSRRAGTGTT